MSENTSTETGTENTTPPEGATGNEGQGELPEWARDKLTKANNEAATYRVKARDLGTEVETLRAQIQTLTSEKTEALDKGGSVALELVKLQTALAVGVPGEQATTFAELLKGDSVEEIKASAEKAKALLAGVKPPAATDRSQGQGASTNNTPADDFHGFVLGRLGR